AGTATLVLSGTSTYTGATTVSAGTLHIAGTGSIISDTDVASGASLVNEGMAHNVTNAGTSSNSGNIASLDNTGGTFDNKTGGVVSGTADISGGAVTNEGSIQGLSTISGGSLGNSGILAGVANQVGGTFNNLTGGTADAVTNVGTGSNAGTIASLDNTGGTFDNKAGGIVSGTADISGGAVTNEGSIQGLSTISGGSLGNSGILAGVANQAGGTFNNLIGGTAEAVTNVGTGSNAGTIASLDNTGGTFDNKTGGTISGTADISGGAVTNEGLIQGLSTISGGSLGNSGILAGVANQVGGTFNNLIGGTAEAVTNVGTGSNAGIIASLDNTGGTFDNKTGGTVSGLTSVTGGTVNNEGTLAGNAEIGSAGTLVLKNGSVTGSVNDSGLLTGVGSVGNTTIKSGGTVAPGANGVGTLAVNGSFTQDVGSTYQVVVDPASNVSNAIVATKAADITGATLNVTKTTPGTPYQLGAQYTVLTASEGVTGTYDLTGDTALSAFAGLTDVYDTNHVYLKVAQTTSFTSLGGTYNQTSTAAGLQSLPEDNALLSQLALGLPDDAAARAAFDQLSGEIHPSIAGQMIEDSRFVRDAALDRLTDAFCGVGHGADTNQPDAGGIATTGACWVNPDRIVAWGHGFGSWGQFGSDGNAASMSRSIGGFITGLDAPVGDDWRAGVLAGYSQSNFSGSGSSATSNDYTLGLYGGRQWDALSLKLGAAYSLHDIDTDRAPLVPGIGLGRASASYLAGTAQAFGELAYRFQLGGLDLEPFANLAFVNQHVDDFRETGGDAALWARSQSQNVGFSTLGLHAATSFEVGSIPVTAKAAIGWQHAVGDVQPSTTFNFAGGSPFTTNGLPIARDAAVMDAGLDFQLTHNTALGISYGGQFSSKRTDQSVRGTLSVRF
ncbi:autotransporter domain-containing protein, partial [Mesorhizobium sp. M7A.F.Ca.US.006.01.1.1]|uniref:autotransporter outer membrane beta-barrel domain-containing protein n=1 Tax=Mesorhizobium sp. M7A.F.Ca.US.006.01.1.1 TaxID=2496707 RepID=UPI000FCBB606